ncbi:MAG: PQQ-binding-like beta-propeller repeat protein [Planctomycetes bacterium]|nr:PQQ-binding-like beta-propeller repeat protein [Planctomycetota bacterium]
MHLAESSERRGRPASQRWTIFPLVAAGLFLATVGGSSRHAEGQIQVPGFGRMTTGEQDTTAGVYLPTDRTLSRAIARARERLAQHEYHEALAFLHGLLGRQEDWFLERSDGAQERRGAKATARQLIGELPPEGRDAYELLHGTTARKQLEAALQSGSRDGISQVVRQYFHTTAGYEAALVLAQLEADQGHRLAAAQLYQELIDSPRAAAQFEPQLSVLAALNHLAAGNRDAAADTMRSLIERQPSAEITFAGKKALVPSADADLVAWLSQFVGVPTVTAPSELNWLTARGDPARNALKPGGRPHLRTRWQARVINDPSVEAFLAGRSEDFAQRGVVVIPASRPVAVGDVVVMRTPENIVAVDWQSGKRIWETREDDELEAEDAPNRFANQFGQVEREQWAAQGNPLEERMWDDSLVMSLSSDGERVFVLRGARVDEDEQVIGWQMAPGFGRVNGEVRANTNQLAAYDIATQGKLVWELDGARAPAPLDGAFFLGAPLAIDNTLYVMAEIRSAIYLFALDPATGHVQWHQQLVGLEQSVGLDPARRRAGATPSYDAGILICPTSASAVIAIDVVKREFAWVYRYPREPQSPADLRNMWQNQAQSASMRTNNNWLDSAAIIGEGHVFITPPESSELHCIDLRTGKFAWKHRQGESLFVAGVDRGNVLLIGAEGVQALRVSDGSAAWQPEVVPLPEGALPAGQGYMSDGRYYLPLTTGEIAAIETADGTLNVFRAARPGAALGNLICYRGSILSQSALVLDKFEQLDVLKQRVEKTLAANPNDATALRELAELKRTDGQTTEAVGLLKRAFELAAGDALAQEMLTEVLLEALATDYAAFRDDIQLLNRLIHDRQQQIELMRIEASGLDRLGQRLEAFDAYLRLADFTAEGPVHLRIDPDYSVRSDRWICGRLGALWSNASEDERAAILKRLTARRPRLDNPRTAAELRHYLAHAGELPGANDVRRALARFLIDRKRHKEAESELLELSAAPDAQSNVIAELINRLAAESLAKDDRDESAKPWPRGQVDAELIPAAAGAVDARSARAQAERQAGYRQLRIEQDTSLGPAMFDWFVAMDCSELVGRNVLGDDVLHLAIDQNSWARPYRDSSLVHAGRLGRLLFVTLGGQVMAIDSPRGAVGSASDVLWQTDPFGRYSADPLHKRRVSTESVPRANRRPAYHSSSGRRRMVGAIGAGVHSLGPVTPRGVVFQEQDQLKCVDPNSGELLWVRTDIPVGCELFGDMEYVFAADVGARVAHVIRTVDGRMVGKRELPKYEWLITVGRNVAEVGFKMNRDDRALVIRISDLFSNEVLYSHEFPLESRVSVVEPNAIAVFEPSGTFKLIDARSGEIQIDAELEPLENLHSVNTMRAGGKLFVFVSVKSNEQQFKPLVQQSEYPIVNGMVYAFSQSTGKPLWPAPAVVRNRGIVLSQPQDIPLLVFAERKTVRDAATGGGSQLRLLCLNQETGQTVYRNDTLPDTSITRFRIRGERDAGAVVAVEMNAGTIQLTMTDRPSPPQPPANDDLETRRDTEERGLRRIGRRMSGVLQGAIENSAERAKIRQFEEIERARQEMKKAELERIRKMQLERTEKQDEDDAPQTDDD